MNENKWLRRIERERLARRQAEALLEEKSSQLFEANQRLEAQVELESTKSFRQERKFKTLFDSSVDGIILSNERGEILEVNEAFCDLIGTNANGLIGRSLRRFLPLTKEINDIVRKSMEDLSSTGVSRFECALRTSSSKEIPCEVSAKRFLVDDEVVVQGIVRDITERKNAALGLERATQAAIDANEAKSLFLATMSHEIRTPLNGIIGFTDLMLQEDLTEEHQGYLDLIKKSGGMLLSIINDILDFSKIENRQIELEGIDFDLQECVEGALDIHSQTAALKDVDLLYEIGEDVDLGMHGDMGRLQQILLNLVSNALKFTEEGSVIIFVRKICGDMLEIEVRDTGIGFDECLKEKLFSPFQQEDASTTRKYGGTGLGLAICKELIGAMGGEITAKSEIGKGSSFIIRLPHEPSKLEIRRIEEEENLEWLKGKKALVVDDHEVNLTFMKVQLSKWNMDVSCALTGHEALKILEKEKEPYAVIFLDMLMPDMDGFELAESMNDVFGENRPPMMLVTSARVGDEKKKALSLGFNSVVYKPVHQKELFREIRRIMVESGEQTERRKTRPSLKRELHYALLVEDNPINAKLAKIMIERLGLSVHIAHNGEEAIEAMRLKSIYEVVFMDMQMPTMDGLEASSRIRKGDVGAVYQSIPIVALTANAQPEDERKCEEAGMTHYLSKPIDLQKLKSILRDLGFHSDHLNL